MEPWITLWGIVLAVTLLLYTGLFLWVAFGGLADIRAMLQSLDRQHREAAESSRDHE